MTGQFLLPWWYQLPKAFIPSVRSVFDHVVRLMKLNEQVFADLLCGFMIWATNYGLGQHSYNVPKSDATMNNLIQTAGLIWYAAATNFLKISAVLFYARVFDYSALHTLQSTPERILSHYQRFLLRRRYSLVSG